MGKIEPLAVMGRVCIRSSPDPIYLSYNPTTRVMGTLNMIVGL